MFEDNLALINEAKRVEKLETDNLVMREALNKIMSVCRSSYDDGRETDCELMAGDLKDIACHALESIAP